MNVRMKQASMKRAATAWARSLPIIIIGPSAAWIIFCVTAIFWDDTGTDLGSLLVLGWIAAISGALVHLLSYAIIGLPLFLRGYSSVGSRIWTLRFTVAIGVGSAFTSFLLFHLLLQDEEGFKILPLIVPVYVIWTALGARRFKPSNSEQDVPPNA